MGRLSHGDILQRASKFSVSIGKEMYALSKMKEYYIAKDCIRQIIRSSSSIGANLAEADVAISRKEFNRIVYIALRESKETEYRYILFEQSFNYNFQTNINHLQTIIKILVSITNSIRKS